MQLEFDIEVETVKKKTRSQKEEEMKHLYKECLFYGHLELMSRTWNVSNDNSSALSQ